MKRLLLATVAFLAVAATPAFASTVTGSQITTLRYGVSGTRISIALADEHANACGGGTTPWYTFSGKGFWAQAVLEALENNLTVNVTGKGTCTLGVEEVLFFDVVSNEASLKAKGQKAAAGSKAQ